MSAHGNIGTEKQIYPHNPLELFVRSAFNHSYANKKRTNSRKNVSCTETQNEILSFFVKLLTKSSYFLNEFHSKNYARLMEFETVFIQFKQKVIRNFILILLKPIEKPS
uniref:Uncharacterized protein n=1 Tax=Cacopsylla melanoneura TaxID=428564 RepID=A0A8D9API7_9HEMI